MGKYYVYSGKLQRILGAKSRYAALYRTVRQELQTWRESLGLGETIQASERGFEGADDVITVDTNEFLRETGLAEEFGLAGILASEAKPLDGNLTTGSPTVFPLIRFAMDGDPQERLLTTWGISGSGRTVHVWQVEGEPLCIDIYQFEVEHLGEITGKHPDQEIECDQPMPHESLLAALLPGFSRI